MKGLIYILENVENFKLLNYGNSLGIILESEMIIKREGNNPLGEIDKFRKLSENT